MNGYNAAEAANAQYFQGQYQAGAEQAQGQVVGAVAMNGAIEADESHRSGHARDHQDAQYRSEHLARGQQNRQDGLRNA